MANPALALLEDALRARRLDRTLTTAFAPLETDPSTCAATEVAALDAALHGGLPRGQLSEIVGPHSSGRTLLWLQVTAAAARRGELAALVDTVDRFDVASAVAAGVDLERLLWIRGQAISSQWPPPQATEAQRHGERVSVARGHGALERSVDRALKAFNLVLQAGGFGLVALDLADVPAAALARIPFTTWLRVQRTIEGSDTVCVLLAPQPLALSAGGMTLMMTGRATWAGQDRPQASGLRPQTAGFGPQTEALGLGPGALLSGMDVTARLVSPRRRVDGQVHVRCGVCA